MASANALGFLLPLGVGGAAVAGLSVAHIDWKAFITNFVTGPGRTSRILLAVYVVLNWKNMPFMWTVSRVLPSAYPHILRLPNLLTMHALFFFFAPEKQYRVWGSIIRQYLPFLRPQKLDTPMLFHYAITSTYTSLLETDYNLHKSNSTYFSDLDVSRSHCVSHLLKPGMQAISANAVTQCVLDKQGQVVPGGMGIGLGAVFCSFRKEIAPFQGYEMWTRVLCWDRKWLYLMTHFVVKDKVRPAKWDSAGNFGKTRTAASSSSLKEGGETWEKYVIATAVSKYVFKVGRFTVHPTILMEQSGLLPERPGGWRYGPDEVGDESEDLGEVDLEAEDGWTWQRVEHQRREGMKFASQFAGLDGLNGLFDGGEKGALGRFYPG